MCFKKKPDVSLMTVTISDFNKVKNELLGFGIQCMMKDKFRTERSLYNVNFEDWNKLLPYLAVKPIAGNAFLPEVPNCDEIASECRIKASKFHLHVLEAWGETPYKSEGNPTGRHAFNMVRINKTHYMLYEPNTTMKEHGRLFNMGDNGYIPVGWRV